MDWLAVTSAFLHEALSQPEITRAFIRALRKGLNDKLELQFLAQGIARPTIDQYAFIAPTLDRNCPDTACIPNTCHTDTQDFTCPGEKGDYCKCEKSSPGAHWEERKQPETKKGTNKQSCRAPADWLGHYQNCKYNYGNVNNRQKTSLEYAQKQLQVAWVCYVKQTGVQDPLTAVNSIETTLFQVRVSVADTGHINHQRIGSRELFERVLSAVKEYRRSEEGWIQWYKETGVCADC